MADVPPAQSTRQYTHRVETYVPKHRTTEREMRTAIRRQLAAAMAEARKQYGPPHEPNHHSAW